MERSALKEKEMWNVKALYPSFEEWKKDLTQWEGEKKGPRWPKFLAFKGKLSQGSDVIEELLKYYFKLDRHLAKLYTYAHLRHDEDVAKDETKQAYLQITSVLHAFRQEVAWIEPEFLQIPQGKLDQFLKSEKLKPYQIFLEKILHLKPQTLPEPQEEILATVGQALELSGKAFRAFNNADLKFPHITDSQGKRHDLTHGKYLVYLRDSDRELRKQAFQTLHRSFSSYENTLCELLSGHAEKHNFIKKARGFSSCLEAALYPHQIDTRVYTSLIETVHKGLGVLHDYLKLRQKVLGLRELQIWDLYVPLVPEADFSMDYETAEKLVIESVLPLGVEYQRDLQKGLVQDRWVDRYESDRKRSGAYSSGCYDSFPYILMNYHGNFHDVMTLAHEAGHSMHSLLSWRTQSYQNADYPIFVAEVASTFHEELLLRHLLEKTKEREKKAYLINQMIEGIRGTFFRQVMFAEFELKLHELVEQGIPVTPTLLKKEYRDLNLLYFGPGVKVDPENDIEWARISHFYSNFYVYQYATGISAAHALYEVVKKEGAANYLKFLSSGGSKYPLELLKLAGVDMQTSVPIESTIRRFKELTEALKNLLI